MVDPFHLEVGSYQYPGILAGTFAAWAWHDFVRQQVLVGEQCCVGGFVVVASEKEAEPNPVVEFDLVIQEAVVVVKSV